MIAEVQSRPLVTGSLSGLHETLTKKKGGGEGREKKKKRKEGVDWDINRGSEPCRNGSPAEDMRERTGAW